MNINLQSKNMELTPAIHDYVIKRVTDLEKLLVSMEQDGSEAVISFDISRNTGHNNGEDVFHADCLIKIAGEEFYGSADEADMYAAIDAIKEKLFQEIRKNKGRKQTLFKRGAASVKKMLKGLSKRNPFTSKY